MVRAKFKVDAIERQTASRQVLNAEGKPAKDDDGRWLYEHCEMQTVKMTPVYGNGNPEHENTKFWQASPSGQLFLGCINLAAAQYFELGKEYYLDFTKAG